MGEATKALFDASGEPLRVRLELAPAAVPVYYGPSPCDVDWLPAPRSRSRRAGEAR